METTIINPDASSRYLLCDYSFSDKGIRILKNQVKRFMESRTKDEIYHQFMEWEKKESEIVLYTQYAYANIKLPAQFDIIFEIGNPANFQEINCTISMIIFDGNLPFDEIGQGHNHVVIAEFPESIPSLFPPLYVFEGNNKHNRLKYQLGLCKQEDFEAIKLNWP